MGSSCCCLCSSRMVVCHREQAFLLLLILDLLPDKSDLVLERGCKYLTEFYLDASGSFLSWLLSSLLTTAKQVFSPRGQDSLVVSTLSLDDPRVHLRSMFHKHQSVHLHFGLSPSSLISTMQLPGNMFIIPGLPPTGLPDLGH